MPAPLVCTPRFITSFDGRRIFTIVQGQLAKPTVTFICLNGLGGALNSWVYVVAALLRLLPSAQVITYEHRGHASSTHSFPTTEHEYLNVLAKDLHAVVQAYQLTQPILIGLSLGGLIIHRYLQLELKPTPRSTICISQPFRYWLFPATLRQPLYRFLVWWRQQFPRQEKPLSIQLSEYYRSASDFSLRRLYHEVTTLGVLPFFLTWICVLSKRFDTPSQFAPLGKKAYFLFGKQDHIMPKDTAEKVRRMISTATVLELETNHCMTANVPEEIATVAHWAAQD